MNFEMKIGMKIEKKTGMSTYNRRMKGNNNNNDNNDIINLKSSNNNNRNSSYNNNNKDNNLHKWRDRNNTKPYYSSSSNVDNWRKQSINPPLGPPVSKKEHEWKPWRFKDDPPASK